VRTLRAEANSGRRVELVARDVVAMVVGSGRRFPVSGKGNDRKEPRDNVTEFFSSPQEPRGSRSSQPFLFYFHLPPGSFSLNTKKMSAEDLYDGAVGIDLGTTYS
jgi:hypothetical protein